MRQRAPSAVRDVSVLFAPGCNLGCALCDCRTSPARRDEHGVPVALAEGGRAVEFRGEVAMQSLSPIIAAARRRGFSTVRVRTNGLALRSPQALARLLELGADEVVLFFPADRANVFDAITRVRGAQGAALAGAAALSAAGMPMILEVPVLDSSLQDLRKTMDLVITSAPTLRAVRLYSPHVLRSPDGRLPRPLAPPRWDQVKPKLIEAVRHGRERGLSVALSERNGIPLCALCTTDDAGRERVPEGLFSPRRKKEGSRGPTSRLGPGCGVCRSADQCPGTTDLYLELHGQHGLTPIRRRSIVRRPLHAHMVWSDARRQAARDNQNVVLRPTVDCNQDCIFCSANETSHNLSTDPNAMVRRIARLARTSVKWVSFSGGEPTLVPQLADYIGVARQAGIERVELVTNAVLLDTPQRVQRLLDAGLTDLFVSLHAHDEELSSLQTGKVGDHARTVRALKLFAAMSNVRMNVNHVLSKYNYRTIGQFVEWMHAQLGTRARLSIAYVTPQYKALRQLPELLPRYSDAMPILRKALVRAAALELPVVVGSRQGVPPCLLGEFVAFSDILCVRHGAATEDAFQKCKPSRCADCCFDPVCTGVWKSYADLYGTDELIPIVGDRVTAEEPASRESASPRRLPNDRPASLRVALVGSGPRAITLARTLQRADDIALTAVVSPHVMEKDLPELPGDVLRVRSLDELFASQKVDAVIVASNTSSHAAQVQAALDRGLPCLVEKPIAASLAEAESLARVGGNRLGVIQQLRCAAGLQALEAEVAASGGPATLSRLMLRRTSPRGSRDALPVWSRDSLFQMMIHHADLAASIVGDGELEASCVSWQGESPPERVHLEARSPRYPALSVLVDLWFAAPSEGLWVEARLTSGRLLRWTRREGAEALRIVDRSEERTQEFRRGGDLELLLSAWCRSVRAGSPPPVSADAGVQAMRFATNAIVALERSGVPFNRSSEPRHARSCKRPPRA